MKTTVRILCWVLVLTCPPSIMAQNESGMAMPAEEATIGKDAPMGNGGVYPGFCAGNRGPTTDTRRSFARWKLPDIPAGATITRVLMSLQQVRVRRIGGPKTGTLQIRRVTEAWDEGKGGNSAAACGSMEEQPGIPGVTWDTAPAVAGANSATANLSTEDAFDVIIDTDEGGANDGLIDDVQSWVDGAGNFGWRFRLAEENVADNARLFNARPLTIEWRDNTQPAFLINPGLNDAWFNDDTAGQGFFIIVFEETGIIFLAWFTYDTERPPEDILALLGEPGHRWLTAQGPYSGDTATLEVFLTEGGEFDSTEPVPQTSGPIGTITIVWHDCENGVLTYDIDPPGVSGEIPITRIVPDNVALCEALSAE